MIFSASAKASLPISLPLPFPFPLPLTFHLRLNALFAFTPEKKIFNGKTKYAFLQFEDFKFVSRLYGDAQCDGKFEL